MVSNSFIYWNTLFFLDASSASHGDMGKITSGDVVILISNSGQSEELKNIIQYTSRNKNIKLIGITSELYFIQKL